ncbi:MAG: hypothetical protein FJZ01_16300 [Candidatus Sericytochromatia bacterium]|nr:hypothetical protein [Candidatus Tanganyikabacteria bacterium]
MPRTKGRASEYLGGGAIDASFAKGVIDVQWSVRLVDTGGDWTSSSAWTFYEIPGTAILGRTRDAMLDGGPWHLTLSILAAAMPLTAIPRGYFRIEVDRVIGGQAWPYFTGVVDAVTAGWAQQEGAIVKAYEIEAWGVSQRIKGFWVNAIRVLPKQGTAALYKMLGVCREVHGSFPAAGPSRHQDLPEAFVTYDLTSWLTLSPNADYSSPYTMGPNNDFTVDTSVIPARIKWTGLGPGTGTPVHYRYWKVEYFGIRRYQTSPPQFFMCPYGRDPRDVYRTEVKEYSGSGPVTITPADPTPFDSGRELLDPDDTTPIFGGLVQEEYLAVIPQASPFTEVVREISSTNGNGVITLASAISPAPVAGDTIRLVTTEIYPAWEEYGKRAFTDPNNQSDHEAQIGFWRDSGATINEGATFGLSDTTLTVSDGTKFTVGDILLIESEMLLVDGKTSNNLTVVRGINGTVAADHADNLSIYVEYERGLFEPHPDAGFAICTGKHFTPSDSIYVTASPVLGPESGTSADENRVEELLKIILAVDYKGTDGIGLFANEDVLTYASQGATHGPTGAYIKNVLRYQLDLSDWVREFKETAMPPNCYIRDEREGKLSIRPYSMASAPDLRILRPVSIQQAADPEPATAVVVASVQELPINMARNWFERATGMDSGVQFVLDGSKEYFCRQARDSGTRMNQGQQFSSSSTSLTVLDGSKFLQGQTIAIDTERLAITAIAGNVLTVTRGVDGTVATAHPDGQAIYIVDARDRGVFNFNIPKANPYQAFPFIDSLQVYGTKDTYITVAIEQDGTTFFIPEATYLRLGGTESATKIPGESINRAASSYAGAEWKLQIQVYADNMAAKPGRAGGISEIEIWTRTINAHRAELTDDQQLLPGAYRPLDASSQFGSIFVQTNPGSSDAGPGNNVSYLWAPSSYLKRVCPKWAATASTIRHRFKILRLPGISLHDCRSLAEEYLLEETYKATPFEVTAPLDDRIEIGDTVSLDMPDGTNRVLFVEGISDGGGPDEHLATYTLTDRSAANRQAV